MRSNSFHHHSQPHPCLEVDAGHGVEEEVGMLAVGAALWLDREKTCWALLQHKQTPQHTIQNDLAFPCVEDKVEG